jgi:hypothetical protein
MRFRLLYLEEKEAIKVRNLTELKNLVGTAAGKPVDGEEERKKGLYFQISSLGAWSIFKKKLTESLGNFKLEPTDALNLKFVSGRITLYVKYEKSTVKFYFTTRNVKEPEWEKEIEEDKAKDKKPSKDKPEEESSDDKEQNK